MLQGIGSKLGVKMERKMEMKPWQIHLVHVEVGMGMPSCMLELNPWMTCTFLLLHASANLHTLLHHSVPPKPTGKPLPISTMMGYTACCLLHASTSCMAAFSSNDELLLSLASTVLLPSLAHNAPLLICTAIGNTAGCLLHTSASSIADVSCTLCTAAVSCSAVTVSCLD
jgi:hypothetical protein